MIAERTAPDGEINQPSAEPTGEISDAEHLAILDNAEADRRLAAMAIKRAVARGMSRRQATELYGVSDGEPV